MPHLFPFLLGIHIAGGSAGLICGTLSAVVQKGGKVHKAAGKIFFWSMLIASIAALVLSNMPDHHSLFLFAVGGFTLYMILSGYRVVIIKRHSKMQELSNHSLDYAIQLAGLLFGLFLLWMGINSVIQGVTFGLVPFVFGVICANFARIDFSSLYHNKPVLSFWMRNHIIRMMGAMIATYTAFLVVNVKIEANWILWLLPSVIGSMAITYFIKKYIPPKKLPNPIH